MLINLRNVATQDNQILNLEINERLPLHVVPPCHIKSEYHVQKIDDYFLLKMNISGEIKVRCQRCLEDFVYLYHNQTEIAACNTESRAETLMSNYETVLAMEDQLDINELITDELHLYCPMQHPHIQDCDQNIVNYLGS